jgi:hypothetical protein
MSGVHHVPSTSDMSNVVCGSLTGSYQDNNPHSSTGATPGSQEAPLPIPLQVKVKVVHVVEVIGQESESDIKRRCSQGWTKQDVICDDPGAAGTWEVEDEDSDGNVIQSHGWIHQMLLKLLLQYAAKLSSS